MMRFFEDINVGDRMRFGPHEITKEEIITFAKVYDKQPFHLDEAAAKDSMLGGLSASGWHVCSLIMRLMCDQIFDKVASLGSPGVDEVRWLQPVRPGDILTGDMEILDTRRLQSRPTVGLLSFEIRAFNQKDVQVYLQRNSGFVRSRDYQ